MKMSPSLRILLLLLPFALAGCPRPDPDTRDYRQDMRAFVQGISAYAKAEHPGFLVIPQNGQELLTLDGTSGGTLAADYLTAIDGVGREDLFYGYTDDDTATPNADRAYMQGFMDLALAHNITPLVTDYCWTHSKVDDSYAQNAGRGYVSFAADDRQLRTIPAYPATPYNVQTADVNTLADAHNFLYLLNGENFASRQAFIDAVDATQYDVVLMDLFDNDGTAFSAADITALKTKPNGSRRLVVCYMSIGEAEDYRYYWRSVWSLFPPDWVEAENPDWPGNYKVRYWDPAWQALIYGGSTAYLDRILAAGFDGVYLDIIDAFEYFE